MHEAPPDPPFSSTHKVCGFVYNGSIELTVEEALTLVNQLIDSSMIVIDLNKKKYLSIDFGLII